MIDWTVNVGTLVQIAVLIVGMVVFVLAVKNDVTSVKTDLVDMKEELKSLRTVITKQVDHDGRLKRAEDDIRDLRAELKELRHGEGFVLPLAGPRK